MTIGPLLASGPGRTADAPVPSPAGCRTAARTALPKPVGETAAETATGRTDSALAEGRRRPGSRTRASSPVTSSDWSASPRPAGEWTDTGRLMPGGPDRPGREPSQPRGPDAATPR